MLLKGKSRDRLKYITEFLCDKKVMPNNLVNIYCLIKCLCNLQIFQIKSKNGVINFKEI